MFLLFSRADFKEEPAFNWITDLPEDVKMAIRQSKVLFCNGYDFDDFSPSFIMSTIDYATKVGTAVFFDPGPRGKSLSKGTPDERKALAHFLRMSDVLLLTSEEVHCTLLHKVENLSLVCFVSSCTLSQVCFVLFGKTMLISIGNHLTNQINNCSGRGSNWHQEPCKSRTRNSEEWKGNKMGDCKDGLKRFNLSDEI